MLGLILVVGSIGIADSINPSTLVPALWLASTPQARGVGSYALGVFAVYLAGGLVLVFGPGPSLIAALHRLSGPAEHGLEAGLGVLALGLAITVWRSRRSGPVAPRARRSYSRTSGFALGAGIMAVELPTAFMYFGAVSTILAARLTAPAEVSLLITYNILFAAPLLVLLLVLRAAGGHAERWIGLAEKALSRAGPLVLAAVAGVAGAVLVTIGLSGLLAG
jgi:Sap, sulfolipid-1-addressing protein